MTHKKKVTRISILNAFGFQSLQKRSPLAEVILDLRDMPRFEAEGDAEAVNAYKRRSERWMGGFGKVKDLRCGYNLVWFYLFFLVCFLFVFCLFV